MGYYILKEDRFLCSDIYNSLPAYCHYWVSDTGIDILDSLDFTYHIKKKEIKEQMKL